MAKIIKKDIDLHFPSGELHVALEATLDKNGRDLKVLKASHEFISFLKEKYSFIDPTTSAKDFFGPEPVCFKFNSERKLLDYLRVRKKIDSLNLKVVPGKTFQENRRLSELSINS